MAERELSLGRRAVSRPAERRRLLAAGFTGAVLIDLILIAVLMWTPRVRVGLAAASQREEGISVFVNPAPTPIATTGITPVAKKLEPAHETAPTPEPAASSQSPGDASANDSSGPVRLTTGDVRLLKKVQPAYPRQMELAGIEGTVVLDAVIRRDGSIGEITVLQASNPQFTSAALEAVRQWQYTPLPYEGIVTVTLNFVRAH